MHKLIIDNICEYQTSVTKCIYDVMSAITSGHCA